MNEMPWLRYTLCFLTRGDEILMLHRQRPPNRGLWNGVGGRLESGESPFACCLREVREETGYQLPSASFTGLLTWEGDYEVSVGGLYLFTAPAPSGEPVACEEGLLAWKPRAWVFTSPEVVSNLHIVVPSILAGSPPVEYHFVYQDGCLLQSQTRPLLPGLSVIS